MIYLDIGKEIYNPTRSQDTHAMLINTKEVHEHELTSKGLLKL